MPSLDAGSGMRRHRVVLVVERQVVEERPRGVAVAVHARACRRRMMAAELVGEGRVVGLAGRARRREDQAVAVLVLQAFAGERGAPGGGAEQEAAAAGVAAAQMRSPTRWKPNIE